MKICVVSYPNMAFHSVAFLCYCLHEYGVELHFVAERTGRVDTKEGITILVETPTDLAELMEYDSIILPGGETERLLEISWLKECLHLFNKSEKIIGCICAATRALAEFGLLAGRRYTAPIDYSTLPQAEGSKNIKSVVVEDGNLITARGQGLVEFAITLIEKLNCTNRTELRRLHRRYRPSKKRITWDLKPYDK